MDKYIYKAKCLTKYFNIYGYGNFDLSLEELAQILKIVSGKPDQVENKLQEIYERLYQTRMG